ncbi:MAG: hypothetical protein O3B79_06525 [Crenarchaeota archaeon]|nr:hypothetical protein [Thermoproteota archaeon]HJJ21938.1 hypothetical protein [Nitrosopumilus sp.]HJJ24804.1 hypothetical protein [Nitrosopumilus sp.]
MILYSKFAFSLVAVTVLIVGGSGIVIQDSFAQYYNERWSPHIHNEIKVSINSDEPIVIRVSDNEIKNIQTNVGDKIDVTISIGDDTALSNIAEAKFITNYAKKPSGINTYFATNYDDYNQIGLSIYDWYQYKEDLKYSYEETISWNVPTIETRLFTESFHEYVGPHLFSEKELLITYSMNMNQVMPQTQVGLKIADYDYNLADFILPFTIEVLESEKVSEEVSEENYSPIIQNNELKITMNSNSQTYQHGNKITINGQIENYDSNAMINTALIYAIKSPENKIISSGTLGPASNGSFLLTTFAMDTLWKTDGIYVFNVKFGTLENTLSFFYDNTQYEIVSEELTEEIIEEIIKEEPTEEIIEVNPTVEPIEEIIEEIIEEKPTGEIIEEEPNLESTSESSVESQLIPICGTGTQDVNGICQVIRTEEKGGGCLIATATYGTELAPQVQLLREIRDNSLLQTESGSAFMDTFNEIYYSFSPTIADWERESPVFKEAVKIAITPMISSLSLMENANSESEVLGIGISLIALNLGMYVGIPAVVIIGIRAKF